MGGLQEFWVCSRGVDHSLGSGLEDLGLAALKFGNPTGLVVGCLEQGVQVRSIHSNWARLP